MKQAQHIRYLLASSMASVAVASAMPALAQDGSQISPKSAVATQEESGVADIVVTANRRSQSLSDVGVSVASLDGADLLSRGIMSAADLQKVVPGFTAADTGLNVPVYSIRGIGFNDPSLASNSTVAVSVDEVPLPYTAMTQGAVLDLQRLEVLKGPQGTLYGQNATGGAINYIANKPTDEFEMGGQVGFGRFNTATGEIYVSGPITDTLKARIAVNGTMGGDWQRSFTRNDSLGDVAKGSARLQLAWAPTDRLKVDFVGSGWIDRSDTPASQLVAFRIQNPANVSRVPQVFASAFTPANARAADWKPGEDYGRNDNFYQLALKVGYEITDGISVTSITAYSHYDTEAYTDRDGMVPSNFNFGTDGNIKSFYQEVRFGGKTGGLTWSFGGNYRNDKIFDLQANDISEATNSYAAGTHFNIANVFSDQKVETYAFFADGEYQITPQLSAVAGVRYTHDRRDFAGCSADNGAGDTSALYTILSRIFRARIGLPPNAPLAPGMCATMSVDTFTSGLVTDRLAEENVAFRGGLNFKPSRDTLLYASFSRGFKAGSFPTLGAAFAVGNEPATQERVDAVEVGFKTAFFDRQVRLNAAAFNYDYKDKQLRGRIIDPVVGSLSKLVNIPKSNIKGFEVEISATPYSGFALNGAVSYLKTEIKEFVGINLFSQTENFKGQTLNFTPPWSVNAGAQYDWSVGEGLTAFVGTDLTYRSRTSGFLGRDPDLDVKSFTTLDVRAGIGGRDDRWKVTIWGNNVTNEYYSNSVMRNGDTINKYAAKPVTYGILVNFKY